MEDGTREKPYTTNGPHNRAYKFCRCSKCGLVAECTPTHDFYWKEDGVSPLFCPPCVSLRM